MKPAIPTWREVWFLAKREKRAIAAVVMMATDEIRAVQFGPRGGWRFLD